jgi:hypothetical protein
MDGIRLEKWFAKYEFSSGIWGRALYPSCSFQYLAQFNPIHVNWQYIIRPADCHVSHGQYNWRIRLKDVRKKR